MSDDFVGMLREKAEEGDLDSILKPSLGGYTKKSVKEYLSFFKKQQQSLRSACDEAVSRLQAERDAAQAERDSLRAELEEAERTHAEELGEQTKALEAELALLESDMDEALVRIEEDAAKIARLEAELEAEKQRSEQFRQETDTVRIRLDSAGSRASELDGQLAARTAELEAMRETERELRRELAEDKTVEFRDRIQQLMNDASLLRDEIGIRDRELENRALRIDSLAKQEQSNHEAVEELRRQLEKQCERNEWIESENDELGKRLQEQMEQSIALSRENSHLKAANNILQRKLDTSRMAVPEGI